MQSLSSIISSNKETLCYHWRKNRALLSVLFWSRKLTIEQTSHLCKAITALRLQTSHLCLFSANILVLFHQINSETECTLSKFAVTPSCAVQSTRTRDRMPSRGTKTGQAVGPGEPQEADKKPSARSCTWLTATLTINTNSSIRSNALLTDYRCFASLAQRIFSHKASLLPH